MRTINVLCSHELCGFKEVVMEKYVFKNFDEVKALFNKMTIMPSEFFSYTQSYRVGPSDISDMDFYEFDFEPYISLANSLGMVCFGVQCSEIRCYLTHMNIGGHGPLCSVRPINLEQLKDLGYLAEMKSNYCQNLELNAVPIGDNQL